MADHLSKHHDDTVGVQEARGVSLIQSHLCLHRCPGAAAEVVLLRLRAGTLLSQVKHTHRWSSRMTQDSFIHLRFLFSHIELCRVRHLCTSLTYSPISHFDLLTSHSTKNKWWSGLWSCGTRFIYIYVLWSLLNFTSQTFTSELDSHWFFMLFVFTHLFKPSFVSPV